MSEPSTTTTPSTRRSTNSLLSGLLVAVVLLFNSAAPAAHAADKAYRRVAVADPYLEMHTGPGKGYPIFHVIDRGESVDIVMRRTDWFLVRADNGKEGWVDRGQMELTLQDDGEQLSFHKPGIEDFTNARWEIGVLAGDFGGANITSLYGSYSVNPFVSVEAWGSQILGNFSNGWMGSVNVVHEAFPDWRVSPFLTLGAGFIHTEPKSTIIQGEDRTDQMAFMGIGVRTYINRQFVFRLQYNSYVIFTSRDDNEEVDEWKAGFSFFF